MNLLKPRTRMSKVKSGSVFSEANSLIEERSNP